MALGLASRALPAEQVLPAALEIARDVAVNTAPLSVAFTKKLLWESGALSAAEIERKETALHHHLMGRSDADRGRDRLAGATPPPTGSCASAATGPTTGRTEVRL